MANVWLGLVCVVVTRRSNIASREQGSPKGRGTPLAAGPSLQMVVCCICEEAVSDDLQAKLEHVSQCMDKYNSQRHTEGDSPNQLSLIHQEDLLGQVIDVCVAQYLDPWWLLAFSVTCKQYFALLSSKTVQLFTFNVSSETSFRVYPMASVALSSPYLLCSLPSSVKEVRFSHDHTISTKIHPNPNITSLHESDSIPLLSVKPFPFPNLTSLTINLAPRYRINILLPHTITTLNFVQAHYIVDPHSILPPSLINLSGIILDTKRRINISDFTNLRKLEMGSRTTEITFPEKLNKLSIYHIGNFLSPYSTFPPRLQELKIWRAPVTAVVLPPSLTSLTLQYIQSIDGCNLPSLTKLNLLNYSQTVDNLPTSLKKLKLGNGFNRSVNSLPPSLTSLQLGKSFNMPVNKLPHSLQQLTILGYYFNQSIDSLPPNLTSFTLVSHLCYYDDTFSLDELPASLKHLSLDLCASMSHFPPSLTSLHLGSTFGCRLDHLPPSIIYLAIDFRGELKHPPPQLQYYLARDFGNLNCLPNGIHLFSKHIPFENCAPPPNIKSWSQPELRGDNPPWLKYQAAELPCNWLPSPSTLPRLRRLRPTSPGDHGVSIPTSGETPSPYTVRFMRQLRYKMQSPNNRRSRSLSPSPVRSHGYYSDPPSYARSRSHSPDRSSSSEQPHGYVESPMYRRSRSRSPRRSRSHSPSRSRSPLFLQTSNSSPEQSRSYSKSPNCRSTPQRHRRSRSLSRSSFDRLSSYGRKRARLYSPRNSQSPQSHSTSDSEHSRSYSESPSFRHSRSPSPRRSRSPLSYRRSRSPSHRRSSSPPRTPRSPSLASRFMRHCYSPVRSPIRTPVLVEDSYGSRHNSRSRSLSPDMSSEDLATFIPRRLSLSSKRVWPFSSRKENYLHNFIS